MGGCGAADPCGRIALAAAMVLATAVPAESGEAFGGVFAHDVNLGIAVCCYEHGADFEVGARTAPLVSAGRWGGLRLYGLGSVNSAGGVAFAAAGAAWRLPLAPRLYLQAGLGGAVQSGDDAPYQLRPDHLDLGSRFLFEPEASLGWSMTRRLAAEISYVHLSHAQLAGPQNPGLDDLGVRLLWRLGAEARH